MTAGYGACAASILVGRTACAIRPGRALRPATAGLSGFALLALEVIWFRFVIFFVASTSVAFAVMLAVVLAGIGLGALIASTIAARYPDLDIATPAVAAASTIALILSYSGFVPMPGKYDTTSILIDSLRLMLPVSVLSGVLFTVIGRAVAGEAKAGAARDAAASNCSLIIPEA